MIRDYHARGKLLLTGEYVVMQGALALACPTRRGQSLYLAPCRPAHIHWKAFTPRGDVWLEAEWNCPGIDSMTNRDSAVPFLKKEREGVKPLKLLELQSKAKGSDAAVARLESWLTHAMMLSHQNSPEHFMEQLNRVKSEGISAETYMEFEREWGLGSSSSLISLLAQWWDCRPMELHAATQGGSGYDQACATASGPILYQLLGEGAAIESAILHQPPKATQNEVDTRPNQNKIIQSGCDAPFRQLNTAVQAPDLRPHIQPITFQPGFHEHLLFVYTGKKQSTDHSIRQFWQRSNATENYLNEISECTRQLTSATDLKTFMEVMHRHEQVISGLLGEEPVQSSRFSGFSGQTKSLGAWGGDFILAAANDPQQARKFFTDKGLSLHFSFHELLLCPPTTDP